MELADRLSRLYAALIDYAIILPFSVGAAVVIPGLRGSTAMMPAIIVLILIFFGFLGYQLWLLTTLGQTLGKKLIGIKIVLIKDLSNGGFVANVLLRGGVPWVLSAIPGLGILFALADNLFIFREDRRCLHDYIAGTCVIKA